MKLWSRGVSEVCSYGGNVTLICDVVDLWSCSLVELCSSGGVGSCAVMYGWMCGVMGV